jgi:hypothetical protein
MSEMELPNWQEFVKWKSSFEIDLADPPFLFRGQANKEWLIDSSLARLILQKKEKVKVDQNAPERIDFEHVSRAHLAEKDSFLAFCARSDFPNSNLVSAWTFMQHHQAPTRLVDWSSMPEIALFMACRDMDHIDECGRIYVLYRKKLIAVMNEKYDAAYQKEFREAIEKDVQQRLPRDWYVGANLPPHSDGCQLRALWNPSSDDPKLHTFRQGNETLRMQRQWAWFTCCPNVLREHREVLKKLTSNSSPLFESIIIPANQKKTFLKELAWRSITEESLFPGWDGLGRQIKMVTKLEHGKGK